jgi:selenocysteine lyase/cysteine desulfurase
MEDIGQQAIAEHILGLTDRLIAGLEQLKIPVVTPRGPANRSGIITFSVGSAEENVRLMKRLQEKRILVSVRYTSEVGGVRVSCHYYNSPDDIDKLLNAIQRIERG